MTTASLPTIATPTVTISAVTTATSTAVRGNFSKYVNRVEFGAERIVIERRGEYVAVLVTFEDFQILQAIEDKLDIETAHKALKRGKARSWANVKKTLGL